MTVHLLPCPTHVLEAHGQDLGGKVLNVHPRQNEKSNVVDHEVEMLPLALLVPADEHVPILDLPRCLCPSETRHDLTID
jgi:hypothetical protein